MVPDEVEDMTISDILANNGIVSHNRYGLMQAKSVRGVDDGNGGILILLMLVALSEYGDQLVIKDNGSEPRRDEWAEILVRGTEDIFLPTGRPESLDGVEEGEEMWLTGSASPSIPADWKPIGLYRSQRDAIVNCASPFDFIFPMSVGRQFVEQASVSLLGIYPLTRYGEHPEVD